MIADPTSYKGVACERLSLVGTGPRQPEAGTTRSYVCTPPFLLVFALATLRDLPEFEGIHGADLTGGDVSLLNPRIDGRLDKLEDVYPFDDATEVSNEDA